MKVANRYAFKEWASVCRAMTTGRQTVLLRKGGIHERRGSFAIEHDEFWLFPTRFHQDESELSDEGCQYLAENMVPEQGQIRISVYAVVTDVVVLRHEGSLRALRPFHIYADRVLEKRFHYKTPGLMLLVVRAHLLAQPTLIPDSPQFGGCRSWVELPMEIETAGLRPVLDNATFERERREILAAIEPMATA